MSNSVITAGAVYIPGCSVKSRRGSRRVCASDEDAVTMAVEAGSTAVQSWGRLPQAVDALIVALRQSEARVDYGANAHIVREALGLPDDVRLVVLSGTDELSGVEALQAAGSDTALVIASDEGTAGGSSAGAAALIVEPSTAATGGLNWRQLSRVSSLTHRNWAGSDNGREPDARFLAHRDRGLLERLGATAGDGLHEVSRLIVAAGAAGKLPVAGLLGLERLGVVADSIAMGVAGPLAAIVRVGLKHRPRSVTAICATGSGRAVLLTVDANAGQYERFSWMSAPETGAPSASYGQGPELPLPLESPFYSRDWAFTLRLEAARCMMCGYLAFPPAQRPVCPKCRSREWSSVPLPREGAVFACTENRFLPEGFPPALVFVLAELSNGVKYWAPMPPEIRGDQIRIGDPVRLALRCFTIRSGIAAYAMKFVKSSTVEADQDVDTAATYH